MVGVGWVMGWGNEGLVAEKVEENCEINNSTHKSDHCEAHTSKRGGGARVQVPI